MQEHIQQLIDRVERFEIDPGDKALGFAQRLARENRWTVAYSERVIHEYKRFCILALASGHHVTPSEAVDQAWHLHLTYTRSYWERFCDETLGQRLHHEPTFGGSSEAAKFHDWYSETLISYARLFGQEPPKDVWPEPKKRFSHAGEWKWINVGHYWLIPRVYSWPLLAAIFLIAFSFLIGCTPTLDSAARSVLLFPALVADNLPFSLNGNSYLIYYNALCTMGFVAVIILRILGKRNAGSRQESEPELNVDELAVLSGGGVRLAQVAVTRLYATEYVDVTKAGWFTRAKFIAKAGPKPISSGIDRNLYTEIEKGTATRQLPGTIKPYCDRINNRLNDFNLRNDSTIHSNLARAIVVVILLVGTLLLAQGAIAGEDTSFLFMTMGWFTVVCFLLNLRSSKVTKEGTAYLNRRMADLASQAQGANLEAAAKPGETANPDAAASPDKGRAIMNVALLGAPAIEGMIGFEPLLPILRHMEGSSSAGSSSGGGCGGCGGGCGGCGGCGG